MNKQYERHVQKMMIQVHTKFGNFYISIVEFDISLKFVQETNCFILEFKLVNGNERTARILFDILQQELEL